jgi:hypothetical protein
MGAVHNEAEHIVSYDHKDILHEHRAIWAAWWGDKGAEHERTQPSPEEWAKLAIPVDVIPADDIKQACSKFPTTTSCTDGLHPRQVATLSEPAIPSSPCGCPHGV